MFDLSVQIVSSFQRKERKRNYSIIFDVNAGPTAVSPYHPQDLLFSLVLESMLS